MIRALWTTYVAVFAAEVLGDKFLYTTSILATRYRPTPMMLGIAVAFIVKMGVAVVIGNTIAKLSRLLIAVFTAAGFVWIGTKLWRDSECEDASRTSRAPRGNSEAALVSCASVLFSEWADLGQLAAATMAGQFRSAVAVWIGAVAAMMTKAVMAAVFGAKMHLWLRRHVPEPVVRYGAISLLFLLGGLSVAETLLAR